jgi:uncharacterized protein (TIGR00255 family)
MVQSMTGFGSAEVGPFRVEIRSLNHRFLDVSVRMPSVLMSHEIALRETLKNAFARGKVDVFVQATGSGKLGMSMDTDRARAIYDSLTDLARNLAIEDEVGIETLLHWKDLFVKEEVSFDSAPLFDAFDQAVNQLVAMRETEGIELGNDLIERAATIERLNEEIAEFLPDVLGSARERFAERVGALLADLGVEDSRVAQEAATLAERGDISEEISRLRSHVKQLRAFVETGGPVGRKLDFLMQEFNREANTIGSKSTDDRVVSRVIEMKAEIERAREQVQNVQ